MVVSLKPYTKCAVSIIDWSNKEFVGNMMMLSFLIFSSFELKLYVCCFHDLFSLLDDKTNRQFCSRVMSLLR